MKKYIAIVDSCCKDMLLATLLVACFCSATSFAAETTTAASTKFVYPYKDAHNVQCGEVTCSFYRGGPRVCGILWDVENALKPAANRIGNMTNVIARTTLESCKLTPDGCVCSIGVAASIRWRESRGSGGAVDMLRGAKREDFLVREMDLSDGPKSDFLSKSVDIAQASAGGKVQMCASGLDCFLGVGTSVKYALFVCEGRVLVFTCAIEGDSEVHHLVCPIENGKVLARMADVWPIMGLKHPLHVSFFSNDDWITFAMSADVDGVVSLPVSLKTLRSFCDFQRSSARGEKSWVSERSRHDITPMF